ncbi:MAG: hypothetical protein H7839_15320, partial [Magnetococcus sp. YQC-5]
WQDLLNHSVWLRLTKLASGGVSLGDETQLRLEKLRLLHLEWHLSENESDEFSIWMSGTGDPDFEEQRQIDRVPHDRHELVRWLQRPPSRIFLYEDNWREVCQKKPAAAAWALCALSQENHWPIERWREALQTWSDDKLRRRSWQYLATVVQKMPDETLSALAHTATHWLRATAKILDQHHAIFLDLCCRFLAMDHQDGIESDEPVSRAINHPVGHITQALLDHWFHRQPEDRQGLPDDLKPLFTALCNTQVEQYHHARVLLSAHVISMFRVDREWTMQHLLPMFNWQHSPVEARAAWEGFLWSPRLYQPLFEAFKNNFLATAHHYAELGKHGRKYATTLTYVALDPADTFTVDELRQAISALPPAGLLESAQALVNALKGAGKQRQEYWKNRIHPFWRNHWPKNLQLVSEGISEQFARLVIETQDAFPKALETVEKWLRPIKHPHYVVHRLHESGLCRQYPQGALTLLGAIINDQPWAPRELGDCLDAILKTWPDAYQDDRFKRLITYTRRHGHE